MPNPSFKDRLKRLASRAMRPGLLEVNQRLWEIEQVLRAAATPPPPPPPPPPAPAPTPTPAVTGGRGFGIWRGGLDGQAVDLFGNPVPDLTAKYRDELAYWQYMVKVDAPRALGGPFEQIYGSWQRERLAELGQFLGHDGPAETARWCASRSAVEIGAGPYPSIAVAHWLRAVAIDPLADGYTAEDLLPKECHCDEVTYIAAPGEAVPLPGAFADLVVIENCLDHVDDPRVVVHEIHRLLKPGGMMWLLVDLMEYRDHMHPNPFSEESLRSLLASEGFVVAKDRVSEHKSHPNAYGEYRGLLSKPGPAEEPVEVIVGTRATVAAR